MKRLIGLATLLFSLNSQAQTFPQNFKCVSVLNTEIQIHETKLDEWAMAKISYVKDNEWQFEADVIENKINSIILTHLPTGTVAEAHSYEFPFNSLFVSLEIKNKKSTVDCDLK
jgi:hypothetical protein